MNVLEELQIRRVAAPVDAMTALVPPILQGVLQTIRRDVADEVGGKENIKLKMLPRLYREGDGDCGICFEYAVHEAIRKGVGTVVERVADALKLCRISGSSPPHSILFAIEKGEQQLLQLHDVLTPKSRVLTGGKGQPVKILAYLDDVSRSFKQSGARADLPMSIRDFWKADLLVGFTDKDRWVGATVKVNRKHVERAIGLNIAIVPTQQGESDKPTFNSELNLVVCPVPYDGDFMEYFYRSWQLVKAFLKSDAQLPPAVALPSPDDRYVAKQLAERREFEVLRVIEVLRQQGQPNLVSSTETRIESKIIHHPGWWKRIFRFGTEIKYSGSRHTPEMLAPIPRTLSIGIEH